jgi:hypothetical protein
MTEQASLNVLNLSDDHFKAALNRIVHREGFPERIAWWLESPSGIERWLQFELAFELNLQFGREYAVICEHKTRKGVSSDIAFVDRATASPLIWDSMAAAIVELKFTGNWYVRGLEPLVKDVAKVEELEIPAIALICWIIVRPDEQSKTYRWMRDQIPTHGTKSLEDYQKLLGQTSSQMEIPCQFQQIASETIRATEGIESASLILLAHRNQFARQPC